MFFQGSGTRFAQDEFIEMGSSSFGLPSLDSELTTEDIHVWCACLDEPAFGFERLASVLSVDETMRAERSYFEQDRKRFVVRRGILTMILGYYLSVERGRLRFCYGKNGKPTLADTFE